MLVSAVMRPDQNWPLMHRACQWTTCSSSSWSSNTCKCRGRTRTRCPCVGLCDQHSPAIATCCELLACLLLRLVLGLLCHKTCVCFHQVLTYGLLSAAVLRAIMILLGVELIDNFRPVLLGFAGILLYSSYGVSSGADLPGLANLSSSAKAVWSPICISTSAHGSACCFLHLWRLLMMSPVWIAAVDSRGRGRG